MTTPEQAGTKPAEPSEALLSAGAQMANVLYNWSQEANAVGSKLSHADRRLLKSLQSLWDEARAALKPSPEPEQPKPGLVGDERRHVICICPDCVASRPEPSEPIGYLPAYEVERLRSGHNGNVRSARFGPSQLDGDVPVYLKPSPEPAVAEPTAEMRRWFDAMTKDRCDCVFETQLVARWIKELLSGEPYIPGPGAVPPAPAVEPTACPCTLCNALIVARNQTHYDAEDLAAAQVRGKLIAAAIAVEPVALTDATEALRELVALKDLGKLRAKADYLASRVPTDENYAAADKICTDIAKRTPVAWDKARAILAAAQEGGA